MKQLTDEELMHDVAGGNLDAMTFIFERYHLRIYNFLYQMLRDKDVAEDITQNVFYKAIRYRSSYKGGQFVSWIFKIARNLLSSHYQEKQRSFNNIKVDDLSEEIEINKRDSTEDIAHLHSVLKTLKEEDRELIIMNRLQGMKYDAIAVITNSTEGAVKVKVHRIIKKLRTVYFETT